MYLQNKYTSWYNNIIANAKSRVLPKELYTESHHIIPRSLGGTNDISNLVKLTAKEHRLVHILLPKMTIDPEHTKSMWYAAWMILRTKNKDQNRTISKGKAYELAKMKIAEFLSDLHKGKPKSEDAKRKMSEKAKGRVSPNKGKLMSIEQKKKLSTARTGLINSPETIAKILETRKGYKHSEETKQKIGKANKGKTQIVTEEQRKKISKTLKGRTPTWLVGKPAPNRGIAHSEETIKKLQLAAQHRERLTCVHCGKSAPKCSFTRWHGDNCKHK
jgi:5-methylcytosine-specific restriction endonuclease McrA